MAARMIDAEKAKFFIADVLDIFHVSVGDRMANMLLDTIGKLPTADAVEVVRCKDCKHWHEETGWCYHHSHFIGSDGEACHPWESNDWKILNADDFCSYGERKDNG